MGSSLRPEKEHLETLALGEYLPFQLGFYEALAVAGLVSFLGTFVAMPKIIRKLHGAGIVGRDINKPDRPEVAEMGGIGVFLGFYTGAFVFLTLHGAFPPGDQILVLVALITAAGAGMTGVMDDLIELRQRFKAFIPIVFAAPLALYVQDYTVTFPLLGTIDFGLLYPIFLVPIGIACASNGFNMLEGYNGLGAGLGIIMAAGIAVLAYIHGNLTGLVLLAPLAGALLAFLWFNKYPAKAFPGDTMTLLVGAVLAAAAMLSKVEFWGALLFVPHVVEFFLKAKGSFEAENFAKWVVPNPHDPPMLEYEGPTESLVHIHLKQGRATEPRVSQTFWALEIVLSLVTISAYIALF